MRYFEGDENPKNESSAVLTGLPFLHVRIYNHKYVTLLLYFTFVQT